VFSGVIPAHPVRRGFCPAAHQRRNETCQRKPVFPQFFPYFCPPPKGAFGLFITL